jgi:predicted permease
MALHDLRHSLRSLRRTPAFTATAVTTLTLAIAALATVFTFANTLFFRPLDAADAARTVVVASTRRQGTQLGLVSYPDYARLRDTTRTLDVLAAHYSTAPLWGIAKGYSKELDGAVVSANFFSLFGVRPLVGRFFHEDEDRVPDRDRVAVLGHSPWRDWFGSSRDVLGATLTINNVPFTIVGVAPASFRGVRGPKDVYIPMMMVRVGYRWCDALTNDDCTCLDMIGHLAEGRTLDDARAEMSALVPSHWARAPEGDNSGLTVYRRRGAEDTPATDDVRLTTLLALASAVLMLVCCANLAGLFIARNSARARELAIRASLGASRGRLIGQMLTESILLSSSSGVLAVCLSAALTKLLAAEFYAFDVEGYSMHYEFSMDPIVMVAVLAASLLGGILVGLVSALPATGLDPGESLKRQSATTSRRSVFGRWLVGAQAAAAVALVSVAAMLMLSAQILAADINLDASHVAGIRLRPGLVRYPEEKAERFQRDVMDRLLAMPEVESLSLSGLWSVLGGDRGNVSWAAARPTGSTTEASSRRLRVGRGDLHPRAFATLGIPVRRGREFVASDQREMAAVAVVNETLARQLWPSRDALGASLIIDTKPHEVIGVVADVLLYDRATGPTPYVYVPARTRPGQFHERLVLRIKGDPATILPRIVREVNRVDPSVPVTETVTLPFQLLNGELRPARMSATFLAYTSGLSVLLCGIGLYGTLTFSVSRRTKEIGIRQAIGATPRTILRMIVREGLIAVLAGVAAGAILAMAGTPVVQHLLYGSPTRDAAFYATACALVLVVGLVACWTPARRAARVQPLNALRDD